MSKTFSYSFDPSESDRDWVRWRLGDTDCDDPLQYDEEIDAALASASSKYWAAKQCATAIVAKLSRKVDSRMGKLDLKLSQKYKQFSTLAAELEAEARRKLAAPWMAAHSRSRKDATERDSDRVDPAFAVGMTDTQYQDYNTIGSSTNSRLLP